jgi:hypothetical protein
MTWPEYKKGRIDDGYEMNIGAEHYFRYQMLYS